MKQVKPELRIVNYKKDVFSKAALVADFIFQIGESKQLRRPSKEVPIAKVTSAKYRKKFKYLKDCLIKYRNLTGVGRGIAAVQVGFSEKFAVIVKSQTTLKRSSEKIDLEEKDLLIIINPKITRTSKERLLYPEGCMSACQIITPVARPAWIEFKYIDESGKSQKWERKANNLPGKIMNRVFQHEIDHMEGIINTDRCRSEELFLDSDPNLYNRVKFKSVK
jgi:peptide deformylase